MSYLEQTLQGNNMLTRHLLSRFPTRFKRMIYVASIFGCIYDTDTADMEIIQKLNDIIDIAHDTKTCKFPVYVHKAIWSKITKNQLDISSGRKISLNEVIQKTITLDDCTSIGELLAKGAPAWLRYGSLSTMTNDVVLLIKQLQRLQGQPMLRPT